MWVGFKCNGLVNFFSERRYFKHKTCNFPPCPPPPPIKLHLLSLPTPLPPPPPKLRCCEAGTSLALGLRQRCSREGWPIKDDSCSWHIWWIRAVGEFGRSTGGMRWPTATPPPSTPAPLVSLVRDWRQMGGGGGGGVRLGLHVVHKRPISTRELTAAYTRPLGCDLNSKFFFYNFMWIQWRKQR